MAKVWVFIEEDAGEPSSLGLELLSKARTLGDVTAIYLGEGGDDAFATVGQYGASEILHADPGDSLPAAPVAAALAELVGSRSPDLVLFGQSYTDRDVAGRLAARLGASVLSNASDVEMSDGRVLTTHEIFGGAQLAKAEIDGDGPYLVIVRPKSFPAEPGEGASPSVTEVDLPDVGGASATITEHHVEEREGPQLGDADVIVSGGRGLGSAEAYDMIERLAKQLGAATGSHPGHRRRRLGPLRQAGGPDRQDGQAQRLHRGRDLGSHAAPGGDEGLQHHHRHQQGPRRPHLRSLRPGRGGRRPQRVAQADRGAGDPLRRGGLLAPAAGFLSGWPLPPSGSPGWWVGRLRDRGSGRR